MNRAIFPAVTVALSGMVFAAVWTMTEPAAAGVPPLAAVAVPVMEEPAQPISRILPPVAIRHRAAPTRRRRSTIARYLAPAAARQETASADVFYHGCRAVRAAGAAPLYRGQPGYRREMDGDNDGIACEPYRG